MNLVSKPILGTSVMSMIIKLAVGLFKSTNGGTGDFDRRPQFYNITSLMGTLKACKFKFELLPLNTDLSVHF